MKDFDKCVTHHYGCDCREEKFKRMEAALREILDVDCDDICWKIARQALDTGEEEEEES